MQNEVIALLLSATALSGQNIIYNEARDKAAKETLDAAKKVSSSSLSKSEMGNLATIEQNQIKSAIEWYRVTMRANIQAFRQWHDVRDAIADIRAELESRERDMGIAPRVGEGIVDLENRRAEVERLAESLKRRADNAKRAAGKAVQRASGTPAPAEPGAQAATVSADLKALGERVGQFDELLGFAGQLAGSLPKPKVDDSPEARDAISTQVQAAKKAVEDIQRGIREVQELAASVESIVESWKKLKVDPRSLAPSPEKIAMELLQREAEFIKSLTAIRVRRYLEVGEMRNLLRRFDAEFGRCRFIGNELNTQITDDLARFVGVSASRENLEQRLLTLLLAAQISARQTGGQTVDDLRESIEYRRFQVSRHSVYNGSYETALQAAAQRLAAYYASGLKPTQVAEFLYQLGTAVALPYIAVTK